MPAPVRTSASCARLLSQRSEKLSRSNPANDFADCRMNAVDLSYLITECEAYLRQVARHVVMCPAFSLNANLS